VAVQKSRKSRARRGMRRSHDALVAPTLSKDIETGEMHLRHHITPKGFYRGKRVIPLKEVAAVESAGEAQG
jgi:large subunit ribosomal protein L32